MSEQEREAIADAADMIVNNYAFTKDGGNIRLFIPATCPIPQSNNLSIQTT